jgi:hypothetical protein
MGRACGMHGRKESCTQGFGGRPVGKNPFGKLDIDGRIILMNLQEIGWEGHGMD